MLSSVIALSLGLLLSTAHFLSHKTFKFFEKFHDETKSLSAGMFITYIILEMFPEIGSGASFIGENVYLLFLAGFVSFHALEKFVYQHVTYKSDLLHDLEHLHVAGFVLDGFLAGLFVSMLLDFPMPYGFLAFLAFIPFLLHVFSSAVTLEHLHEHLKTSLPEKIFLSSAPFLGALASVCVGFTPSTFYMVFSFLTGTLFYSVVRDAIPSGKVGKLNYFFLGIALSLLLLYIARFPL